MSGAAAQLATVLEEALPALAKRRPVFHSEADFQLALAWEIQAQHPAAQLRMELRILDQPRINLDVFAAIDGRRFALELKYLRAPLQTTIDGERFVLVAGAVDFELYDTIKDLVRLELLLDRGLIDAGAAVVLSNSAARWRPPTPGRMTGFESFRIHTGAELSGTVEWGQSAGAGTRRGRELPQTLTGVYRPAWQPYARVPATRNGELRTLTLVVPPEPA